MGKPRLGVDVDGVIAAFDAYALPILNARLGTAYTPEDITTWSWGGCFGPEADRICWEIVGDARCFAEMAPIAGALGSMRALAFDYDLWYITSIPNKARRSRRAWLARHDFPCADQMIPVHAGDEKARLAVFGDLVAFIEDKTETAVQIAETDRCASFLVERPYNRCDELVPGMRRGTLEEITSWLLD